MFPNFSYSSCKKWSGHRPATVDSLPVIGTSELSNNIFFGYGHQHIGLTSGPKTGSILTKAILNDNDVMNLQAYRSDRH